MAHIAYTFKIALKKQSDAKLFDKEEVYLDENIRIDSTWFKRKICLYDDAFETEDFYPGIFITSIKRVVPNCTIYVNGESLSSEGGAVWISESDTEDFDFYDDYEGIAVYSTVGSEEWLEGVEELKKEICEEDNIDADETWYELASDETDVLYVPKNVTELEDDFDIDVKCKKIVFSENFKRVGRRGWGSSKKQEKHIDEIIFKGDIERIGEDAFSGMDIGILTFEGHVKTIGEDAFHNSKIRVLNAKNGIDNIGASSFRGCDKLKEINISYVKKIEDYAFAGDKNLATINIGKINKIGSYVFLDCKKLSDEEGNIVYDGIIFQCSKKASSVPEGVVRIDKEVYRNKKNILLSKSVREIGEQFAYKNIFILPDSFFQTNEKFVGKEIPYCIDKFWNKQLTIEDWASIYLFQSEKEYGEICKKYINYNQNDFAEAIVSVLENYEDKNGCLKASEYFAANVDKISREIIKRLYDLIDKCKVNKAKKILKPYVE